VPTSSSSWLHSVEPETSPQTEDQEHETDFEVLLRRSGAAVRQPPGLQRAAPGVRDDRTYNALESDLSFFSGVKNKPVTHAAPSNHAAPSESFYRQENLDGDITDAMSDGLPETSVDEEEKVYIMKFSKDPKTFQAALHDGPELEPLIIAADSEGYHSEFRDTSIFVHVSQYEFVKDHIKKHLNAQLLKPHHVVVSETYKSLVMSAVRSTSRGAAMLMENSTFKTNRAKPIRKRR